MPVPYRRRPLAALAAPFALLPLVALPLLARAAAPAQEEPGVFDDEGPIGTLHRAYGFDGMIISKLNDGVSNLVAFDLDGDGRDELLVANNGKAKIEILTRGDPEKVKQRAAAERQERDEFNELADEIYFERVSVSVEEKVTALAAADVNGDGRVDLLWLGDSGKLSVVHREEDGSYGTAHRHDVESPSSASTAVRPADVNGDGRSDVVVLCSESTTFLMQDDNGGLAEKLKLPNATKDAAGFDVLDLDGDGLLDLFYVKPDDEWPFRYRLGRGALGFGPEIRSRFTDVRAMSLKDFDGDGKAEVLAVRRRSGRLALLRLAPAEVEDERFRLSSLRLLPFLSVKDPDKRTFVLHDVDGDARPDLVAAEPSAARVVAYRDLLGAAGGVAQASPSFVGVSRPRFADFDGDGRPSLVIGAADEGAIGVAEPGDGGSFGFPRALALPDGMELLALDAADADGDGTPEIVVLLADGRGKKRARLLVRMDGQGQERGRFELPEVKGDPAEMLHVDLNRDGRLDVMAFIPREVPLVLLATGDPASPYQDLKADGVPGFGILKGVGRGAVAWGDVDGDGKPELLVPGPNFARAFTLAANGTPEVIGQYNLPNPGAEVTAVQFCDLDGDGVNEILLVDKGASRLRVLSQAGGPGAEVAHVDLGGMQPSAVFVADLDGNGRPDVLLGQGDRFGVVQNGGSDPTFAVAHDFEVPIKNASIDGLTTGDVNSDGGMDAVLIETNRHLLAVVAVHGDELEYALKFPVFESRIFERGRASREPREVVVAEVSGDGKKDIAILVHDRLIVYPQE